MSVASRFRHRVSLLCFCFDVVVDFKFVGRQYNNHKFFPLKTFPWVEKSILENRCILGLQMLFLDSGNSQKQIKPCIQFFPWNISSILEHFFKESTDIHLITNQTNNQLKCEWKISHFSNFEYIFNWLNGKTSSLL